MPEVKEVKGEDYTVNYDADTATVNFQGELALASPTEYKPIKDLLEELVASEPATTTLNLRELTFLNSSGISMLSKFVIGLRKKPAIKLVVLCSDDVPWQSKSLGNFKKLLPTMKLDS